MIKVNDWVEVLQENLRPYKPTASVAHFGRVVKTSKTSSQVVIEVWGRHDSFTNYFPLKFNNSRLRVVGA
jgi:hypothetical protein